MRRVPWVWVWIPNAVSPARPDQDGPEGSGGEDALTVRGPGASGASSRDGYAAARRRARAVQMRPSSQ